MNIQYVYRCNVGYYGISSEAGSASGCSICPDATDVYVDSALSQYATVSGGYITSVPGANGSMAQCYLKGGTYYDAIGTYKYAGVCYQDGTAGAAGGSSSGGVDCSFVVGVCTNSSGTAGAIVSGTKSNVSGGTNCWCNVAGKSFFLANLNTYCSNACASACSSWVANDTNSVATKLGCAD